MNFKLITLALLITGLSTPKDVEYSFVLDLKVSSSKSPKRMKIEKCWVRGAEGGLSNFELIMKRKSFALNFKAFPNLLKLKFHPEMNVR